MGLILNLETSTKNCSVALGSGDNILALRELSSDQYIHSEKLHVFIREVLHEAGVSFSDLDAVAVGKGPGSYTGLRIGVSSAKGFCYALSIPLISADGLQILLHEFRSRKAIGEGEIIIPMLDARRMEVYCSIHNHQGERLSNIEALVVEPGSFDHIKASKIHLIGDGAAKCREVLPPDRFVIHDLKYPSATFLNGIAQAKFEKGQFEEMAYFSPFYLKDFVAGKPRKLL